MTDVSGDVAPVDASVTEEDPNLTDTNTAPVEDRAYDLPNGGRVYVDENGATCVEDSHGSLYRVEGDHYDNVVALVSLFPDKF